MPTRQLIVLATRWGRAFGGINSFNTDFLSALAVAYSQSLHVICLVNECTEEEVNQARNSHVRLIKVVSGVQHPPSGLDWAQTLPEALLREGVECDPTLTVWLGHDRITGAAALAGAKATDSRAVLIHHMSYTHYEAFAENSASAHSKETEQRRLFEQANFCCAVGPLLRDALLDMLGDSSGIHMLIPGLAEIEPRNDPPKTFTAFLSGRLSQDAARIKQGYLGVAAFAAAQREAVINNMPQALCQEPKMILRGVDFEHDATESDTDAVQVETNLKCFAELHAGRVVNLHALPFTHDRCDLYYQLSSASVALMPSWHEGFGLVGWEAISAAVPLVLSKKSGLYRWLDEVDVGLIGLVWPIDVRGQVAEPYFQNDDLLDVSKALRDIANSPTKAKQQAAKLRAELALYTWISCAEGFVQALGWNLERGMAPKKVGTQPTLPTTSDHSVSPAPSLDSPLQLPHAQWQRGVHADSQLLRAEEAIVPFDPARQPDLDKLNAWLDDGEHPRALRLITGAGGQGKTRLALELCRQRQADGWYTGLLGSTAQPEQATKIWQQLCAQGKPLLLVLDYAETRQPLLLALLKAMLGHVSAASSVPPVVRLLVLARNGGEWWERLPSVDAGCEPFLNSYATSGPYRLESLHTDLTQREQAYCAAQQAFANALGFATPTTLPILDGEHLGRPLYLHMAALMALHGERPRNAAALTDALLNHETRYWRALLEQNPSTIGVGEHEAERLMALATLCDEFTSEKAAYTCWQGASQGDAQVLEARAFSALYDALCPLYLGGNGLQAVRPDLLGEALVARCLLRADGAALLDAVLGKQALANQRHHALIVIARISHHRAAVTERLVAALTRHFIHCLQDMLSVATQTQGHFGELLEVAFRHLHEREKSQVAGVLSNTFQHESVQLANLECVVRAYLLDKKLIKHKTKKPNTEDCAKLARLHLNYAIAQARVGQNEQALAQTERAVAIYARLAQLDRKQFEPEYAVSLNNHANYLSDLGQAQQALEYNQQALAIRKRLAEQHPDRFEPDYAMSLSNHANRLADLGKTQQALECSQQALVIRKRLAEQHPDRFESDYAMSLNNHAARLSDLGKVQQALDCSQQALAIRKRLAEQHPDRFEPDYAMSLSNHAVSLMHLGQAQQALECSQQALTIRKRLAEQHPNRFEPDYATSLNNHANHLIEFGQAQQALECSQQALAIRKRLAEQHPDRFESDYAMSLSNHAARLTDYGRYGEAYCLCEQSWTLYQRLAERLPERFERDVVSTLAGLHWMAWMANQPSPVESLPVGLPSSLLSHEHPKYVLYLALATAFTADNPAEQQARFAQVLAEWVALTPDQQLGLENYALCAAAWCATHAPETTGMADWQMRWRRYVRQRKGWVPQWMLDTGNRLSFDWPVVELSNTSSIFSPYTPHGAA